MRVILYRVWTIIFLIAGFAHADRIYLINGRHLDGLIVSEGENALTLRVEGGEMAVARRRIRKIRYSTPQNARAIEAAWKQKYYLNEAYLPPGMTALGKRMRALQDRRASAVNDQKNVAESSTRAKQLRGERDALHSKLKRAGATLRTLDPAGDVQAYNEHVAMMNDLRMQLTSNVEALAALPELTRVWHDRVTAYRKEIESLRQEVADRYSNGGGGLNREARRFLNRLLIETGRMEAEFRTNTVPLNVDRYGHTVQATINGIGKGCFVIDTGAAVMTLSEAFAKRIGLQLNKPDDTVELVLANGEKVDGVAVLLDRVAVGGVAARDVPAVVLEQPPHEAIDGLLGMSFLGRFQIKMEPGNQRVTFTEFAPGE